MWRDPIVEEIRKIREEHARNFNHDLHAICEDIRQRQGKSGHTVVSRSRRKDERRGAAQTVDGR
jgi:hypothetical protein